MLDLAINNATLVDGTGRPSRIASVGVEAGRVVEIATSALTGGEVIEARDRVLCPGFVDIHSHADFRMGSYPQAETQLTQGVTTLVAGNCGYSPFPVRDVEALKEASSFLRPDLSWRWRDLYGFGQTLRSSGLGVNMALQVGHGSLRLAAMGSENRPPSHVELGEMCRILAECADQGAVGFSTGLIYAPGSYARTEEIAALARTAAEHGLLYSTHVRDEGDGVLGAIDEAIAIARLTGVALQISHIKAMGPRNHGKVEQILDRLDRAAADGIDIGADVYPYTASSTTLASRLPGWALDGGTGRLLLRLGESKMREKLRAALALRFDGEIDPAGIVIADLPPGRFSWAVGCSIADIAEREDLAPAEAVLSVLHEHEAAVAIVNHAMAESDLAAALLHPRVAVASDGWELATSGAGRPHPRSFGTFPRVLGRYVRQKGILELEEAVRKMTSLPASRIPLGERGVLQRGAPADMIVFDPDRITDHSSYDDPWRLSSGVTDVFLQGRAAVRRGRVMDTAAGQVL